MPGKLEDKVAIVTRGSDGIGAETCRRFAREGARIAIMARTEPKGLEVQEEIRSEGGDATSFRINCIRPGQILVPYMGESHPIKPCFEMRQLLNGSGYPEDAANLALFLASDDGRFITAETIDLDGGYGAKV